MKKIMSIFLVLVLFLFTACSNAKDVIVATPTDVDETLTLVDDTTTDELKLLIKAAETEEAIQYILARYNSVEDQLLLAKSKKYIAQKVLINSDLLSPEAFVQLCKDNEFNEENITIYDYFTEAVKRLHLTEEQQEKVIKSHYTYQKILLENQKLTPETYVFLAENNKLNYENPYIELLYKNEFERLDFSTEQRKRLIDVQEYLFQELLLKSDELTGEELVMLCQENKFNMENTSVENWFVEAIERTELTSRQQVAIAHINEYVYHKAIILKTKISYDALLCLARNSRFNLESPEVRQWFISAVERVNPTETQKNTLMLSENIIIQQILV